MTGTPYFRKKSHLRKQVVDMIDKEQNRKMKCREDYNCFCFQHERETVSQVQPFLQFLVYFGSCNVDEGHDEQQQFQNGSDAAVRNKGVAGKQTQHKAGPYAHTAQQQKEIQVLQADDAVQQQAEADNKAYSQDDCVLKKCKQIKVAIMGNNPSDTILFLYLNISFIICRGLL